LSSVENPNWISGADQELLFWIEAGTEPDTGDAGFGSVDLATDATPSYNAKFRLRIRGPVGCSGQTRQISLSVGFWCSAEMESGSNASANGTISMAVGGVSQIASATASVGSGDYSYNESPYISQIIIKEITFDDSGVGFVEVPFLLRSQVYASQGAEKNGALAHCEADVSVGLAPTT